MRRNAERMQYQADRLSFWLCMLSIVFNVVYFVSIYSNKYIAPDITIGADVIVNIVFMMIVFLGGEKLKAYQKKWNIYVILIGAVQIPRIFFVPMHYFQIHIKDIQIYIQDIQKAIQTGDEATVAVMAAILAAILAAIISIFISGILLLLAGINSSINLKILSRYNGRRVGE